MSAHSGTKDFQMEMEKCITKTAATMPANSKMEKPRVQDYSSEKIHSISLENSMTIKLMEMQNFFPKKIIPSTEAHLRTMNSTEKESCINKTKKLMASLRMENKSVAP